jgi:hypothetical protein
MPPSAFVVALFIVFGGRAMGLRRKFVLLGGLAVFLVMQWFPPAACRPCGRMVPASFHARIGPVGEGPFHSLQVVRVP